MSTPERHDHADAAREAYRVDYRETPDVTAIHAAVAREHDEPKTADIPVPIWLLAICAVCLVVSGYYLGGFSGGFSADGYNERAGMPEIGGKSAAADAGTAAKLTMFDQGKKVYGQACAQCHQANGMGLPGQYPPLANSHWVTESPKRLAKILLKGLQGPFEVNGTVYNGAMPAQEKVLTDKKIAAVMTYIRNEWGNSAGEIAPEYVARIRAEYASRTEPWMQADIEQVPADVDNDQVLPLQK